MWPFSRRKAEPEPPKPEPRDNRIWNEDWQIGDTAECIVDGINLTWADSIPPWERPALGQRLVVSSFTEGFGAADGVRTRHYFLHFSDWPVALATTGFRKVRPVTTEKSEIVERILTAKPGADRKREDA